MRNKNIDKKQWIEALPCWQGKVEAQPLAGGITNVNFTVEDSGCKYVARLCEDIPVHQVKQFNVISASRAAHAIGVSPEVVYSEPGVLVIRYIEGNTFAEADVQKPENLQQIVTLLSHFHTEMPKHLRGAALVFWVFQILRDYAHTLKEGRSRHLNKLPRLMKVAEILEKTLGPIDLVFGHNDLLAANIIDDGKKLWLIDFDYAGFNSPLFDPANLSSNNQLSQNQENWMLETYYRCPPTDNLWQAYYVMKCASILRETLWSMVSELHSAIDFDYSQYSAKNLEHFDQTFEKLHTEFNLS
jgi:thiamine kinase-like enzyme